MPDGRACRGICGWHLAMCLRGRALLIQRPRAEQGAGEDAAVHQNAVS
jgi:hypothetical protein